MMMKVNIYTYLIFNSFLLISYNIECIDNFDNIMMASLLNGFSITERDFLVESKNKQDYSGTCAISVLITNEKIYVANLGDSRALLFKVTKDGKYNYMQISRDHKAKLEKKRISKIGGYIKAGRVNGVLEISRTIGDREFKNPKYEVRGPCKIRSIKPTVFHIIEDPQKVILKRIDEKYQTRYKKEKESGKDIDNYIILDYLNEEIDIENTKQDIPVYPKAIFDTYASAFPEVSIIKRDNNDKMILIASDGFYDSFTNKRVLTLYKEMVTNKDHMDSDILNNICKELCEKAKEKGSKDDITTILLCINQ